MKRTTGKKIKGAAQSGENPKLPPGGINSTVKEGNDKQLMDRETLEEYLDRMLINTPEAADLLVTLLMRLQTARREGPEGSVRADNTTNDIIEMLYQRTEPYRLAFQHYKLYQFGLLKPEDEPIELLMGAIQRSDQPSGRGE
jgi:hypothetical protein